jgi:hypothetical protein
MINFKDFLKGWNITRIFRLILGVVIIIQGVKANDWMFIILGSAFAAMPLFNVGCCSNESCETPIRKTNPIVAQKEIDYEEIK